MSIDFNSLTPEQATVMLLRGWDDGTIKNSDNLQHLLDLGADINVTDENGVNPLMKAANKTDDVKCLQLLLQAGIPITARDNSGRTALIAALAGNKVENVRLLVDAGANVNIKLSENNLSTPLMLACLNCDTEIIKILVDASASINATDKFGYTALMIAIELNKIDVIELLLENGAKVDADIKQFAGHFPEFIKTNTYKKILNMY